MNKKQTERIAIIALAAFLVGMFIYQVAHASSYTNYLNGAATRTFDNGTTVHEQSPLPPEVMYFGNTTWTMYNSTSSVSKLILHEVYGVWHGNTWTRILNGHVHKGYMLLPFHFWPPFKTDWYNLQLCSQGYIDHYQGHKIKPFWTDLYPCIELSIKSISPDHMEFKDAHNDTIHLMR